MEIKDKINILKSLDLFSELDDKDIEIIAQAVVEKEFAPHTVLIEQETDPDVAYFIYEGGAKVFRLTEEGDQVNLSICGPGEIVGEMALIDQGARSASVEALGKTKVLTLSGQDFKKIVSTHPQLAYRLLVILTNRVRKLSELMEEVMSKKLPQRTWHLLEILSKYFPSGEITLSQEELARIIGATRARVTEILDDFQKQGKLELSHKRIKLLNFVPIGTE